LATTFKLLARRRAIYVDRDQNGPVAALLEPRGQLAAGGGFAGALQPGHENHVGGCEANLKRAVSLPSNLDQLVAHNLDDLLGGRKRGQHFGAHGLGADVLDEVAGPR
jgi:hypothetical protein